MLTSLQRRFYGIFQNCDMVKQYESIVDPPFVNNVYLMASALDPTLAHHATVIDVEIQDNKAQTSHVQQKTKSKIEELIVKEKALA